MQEKNYDDFFDETKGDQNEERKLMDMVDAHGMPAMQEVKSGSKVEGTVSTIGKDSLVVDLDGKRQGVLNKRDVTDREGHLTVKEGDRIEAYVSSVSENEIVLTRSLSGFSASLDELVQAMKNQTPVEGKVTGVSKGGLQVKVMGRRGFCPISNIDLKYVDDVNVYLGKTMSFVIMRITEKGRNIVVSRLPILEEELAKKLTLFQQGMEDKEVYRGTVTRIADYGLFIDMGGIEGLAHISEISYQRTENLHEMFVPGQEVEYVIIKIDRKEPLRNTKISLSLKQAQEDPWQSVTDRFGPGSQVEGRVTRIVPFGAFVELTPGVEGLVHISEMSWTKRVRHPSEVVSEGDTVRVTILSVDTDKREVSCTLKDVAADPWKDVPERFPVGSKATGKVVSQTKYGFFVELADGVTGLLVHRNIAEDKKSEVKVDAEIEVGIESVDMDNRRIALSYGASEPGAEDEAAKAYMKQQDQQQKQKPSSKPSTEFGEMLRNALNKK